MPGETEFWDKGWLVRRRVLEKDRILAYRRQILAKDLAQTFQLLGGVGADRW